MRADALNLSFRKGAASLTFSRDGGVNALHVFSDDGFTEAELEAVCASPSPAAAALPRPCARG